MAGATSLADLQTVARAAVAPGRSAAVIQEMTFHRIGAPSRQRRLCGFQATVRPRAYQRAAS